MNLAIHGSQMNEPARLYKRFVANESVELGNYGSDRIEIQGNYYVHHGYKLRYVEADDLSGGEYKPITGMLVSSYSLSIRFLGRYHPNRKAWDEVEAGDVLELGDEYWIVQEGTSRTRLGTVKAHATITVTIQKLL